MQELESLDSKGKIELYYADESRVCTDGYVPYGWQFKDENVYIPSEKAARLNIFGMITKRNQYKGFTTQESINADRLVDYLDRLSFEVKKKTVVVLDNASVHRNRKIKEMRKNTKDSLLYCTNRALASVGTNLFVNYSYV